MEREGNGSLSFPVPAGQRCTEDCEEEFHVYNLFPNPVLPSPVPSLLHSKVVGLSVCFWCMWYVCVVVVGGFLLFGF